MPKWKVRYRETVVCTAIIEAKTEEEARNNFYHSADILENDSYIECIDSVKQIEE